MLAFYMASYMFLSALSQSSEGSCTIIDCNECNSYGSCISCNNGTYLDYGGFSGCGYGCADCTSSYCYTCLDGYTFDTYHRCESNGSESSNSAIYEGVGGAIGGVALIIFIIWKGKQKQIIGVIVKD